jgi:hypothetical protein
MYGRLYEELSISFLVIHSGTNQMAQITHSEPNLGQDSCILLLYTPTTNKSLGSQEPMVIHANQQIFWHTPSPSAVTQVNGDRYICGRTRE